LKLDKTEKAIKNTTGTDRY